MKQDMSKMVGICGLTPTIHQEREKDENTKYKHYP
jgi:hypothetical protein